MITINQVKRAMALVAIYNDFGDAPPIERQLAMSLKVYVDRGEFDGTLDSAIGCLTLACYEIAPGDGKVLTKGARFPKSVF